MALLNDTENNQEEQPSESKQDSESIGLIQNLSFLNSFITEFLSQYKTLKSLPWVNSNDILMIILLRILDLLLSGV